MLKHMQNQRYKLKQHKAIILHLFANDEAVITSPVEKYSEFTLSFHIIPLDCHFSHSFVIVSIITFIMTSILTPIVN